MKLINEKTKKEYLVLAFITIDQEDKKFKTLDIRNLKDYILTDGKNRD